MTHRKPDSLIARYFRNRHTNTHKRRLNREARLKARKQALSDKLREKQIAREEKEFNRINREAKRFERKERNRKIRKRLSNIYHKDSKFLPKRLSTENEK